MIDNKKIDEIKNTIINAVSPEKIILFGSYAAGNPGKDSDIDILIIQDSSLNQHQRNMRIRRLFPHRNFSLDVFVFTRQEEKQFKKVKGTILNTAFTRGTVLYERKQKNYR